MVPQELIDEIIDQLNFDIPALKACSTVSSSFRKPCQQRLFRSIILDVTRTANNERLHIVLWNNPILSSSIRCVVVLPNTVGSVMPVCGILRMAEPYARELQLNLGPTIKPKLWERLHPELKMSLLVLLRSPLCVSLTIGEIYLPAALLREIPHLRHLKATAACSLTHQNDTATTPVQKRQGSQGYLTSLTLGYADAAYSLLQTFHDSRHPSSLSLSRLRFCKFVFIMNSTSSGFQMLLNQAAGYLQEVNLGISFDNLNVKKFLNFSRLTALRVLHIRIRRGAQTRAGVWLTSVIATLPAQVVELQIRTNSEIATSIKPEEWSKIDMLLTRPRHSGTLRRLILRLDGQAVERNQELFAVWTPELVRKNILTFI